MDPKDLVDFARRYKVDPLTIDAPETRERAAGAPLQQNASHQAERPVTAPASPAYQEGAAAKAADSPSSAGLSAYDELIGGYRTHVDQDVFIDRQGDGYGLWMYEEADDVWQDHAETYMPMKADALRRYFVQAADADHAIGVGSQSGEHGEVFIAIIRGRPGSALTCGGVVPESGVFAMNGALFVPFSVDRAVGAHYVMFGVD